MSSDEKEVLFGYTYSLWFPLINIWLFFSECIWDTHYLQVYSTNIPKPHVKVL